MRVLYFGCFLCCVFLLGVNTDVKCGVKGCRVCGISAGPLNIGNTTIRLTQAFCTNSRLTDIPKELKEKSKNLGELKVVGNPITLLRNTSFEDYPYLTKLDLSNNKIAYIQDFVFRNQRFLKTLYLVENKITELRVEMFVGLDSLTKLDLRLNKLSGLPQGVFQPLKSLQELSLHDNENLGRKIEDGAFEGLDLLERLHLGSCGIKQLGNGVLGSLMSLKMIDVSFNEIGTVEANTFACTPLLEKLHINNNTLMEVPKEAIRKVKRLKELDLSGNPINYIESYAFHWNLNLQILLLNRSNIQFIQDGAFENFKQLQALYIDSAPLNCDCRLRWLHTWLLGRPNVLQKPDNVRCSFPGRLLGTKFLNVSAVDIKCSCSTCKQDEACNRGLPCKCYSKWEAGSCKEICKSRGSNATSSCFHLNGECHCRNVTQELKVPKCSFKITNRTCSAYAELKKVDRTLECVCKAGFRGDGLQCDDLDECSAKHHCHPNAHCINTQGSHRCRCRKGYRDMVPKIPGLNCREINECEERPDRCGAHALCSNTPGSYLCTCVWRYIRVNGFCYPEIRASDIELSLKRWNTTALLVKWYVMNILNITIASFQIKYIALGHQHSSEYKLAKVYPPSVKECILGGLTPDTTYWVKVIAITIHNITAEAVKGENTGKPYTTLRDSAKSQGSYTGVIIGCVIGVVVLVGVIIALVLCYNKRRTRKREQEQDIFLQPSIMEDLIELRLQGNGAITAGTPGSAQKEVHDNEDPSLLPLSSDPDSVDVWEIPRDLVTLGDRIGEGQFGVVFGGTVATPDGPIKAAIKCIKDVADRFDIRDLKLEMEMMKDIGQHPNIVSLLGTCTMATPLYIVTEYVSGGNLLDLLRQSRRADSKYVNVVSTLTSRDLLRIALDVSRGMRHIAMKKFVHRDLAARNVLMTDDLTAKVADFGLARDIYCEGKYVKTGGGRLPIKWMAPEAIRDQVYTTQTDVWSFGVLLWEIVTLGQSPYSGIPVAMLLEKLLYGYQMPKPSHCSLEIYSIMESCWDLDPTSRPSFDELYETLGGMLSETGRAYVNMQDYCESLENSRESLDDLDTPC